MATLEDFQKSLKISKSNLVTSNLVYLYTIYILQNVQNVHPSFLFQEKDKRLTIFKIQTSAYNSSTKMTSWKNLPDIVFSDIMMILKQNSLEDIHRCRQVCQSWNVMIAQMTKFKKDMIRRKADSLTAKIRE